LADLRWYPINPNVGVLRAIFFDGTSSYNGLQAQVNRQMVKGLQAQASYTWGHCIDTGSSGSRGDTFTNGLNDLFYFDKLTVKAIVTSTSDTTLS